MHILTPRELVVLLTGITSPDKKPGKISNEPAIPGAYI